MTRKFSAYLSIYNDWDILVAALRSVAPYVDELVVVDGAYEWMVPYLSVLGRDPERSDPRVYEAVEGSGIPFRVIARTWKNEVEKRKYGYESCSHRYIYRVDADEVLFFDERRLEAALTGGLAIGEMEMPNYVAPGWISCARNLPSIERQCFLFDREQVESEIHLNYLWLILTADLLPAAGSKPFHVYPEPLAFNAHLTNWRTPETAVNRSVFYTLNWMRQNGVPWLPSLRGRPLTDVRQLFSVIPPKTFMSSLQRGQTSLGMSENPTERKFLPTPLSGAQEACFTQVFDHFLRSLAQQNLAASSAEQDFLLGLPIVFDITTSESRDAVGVNDAVSLQFSVHLHAAKVRVLTYFGSDPGQEEVNLPTKINGRELSFSLPESPSPDRHVLRQVVEIQIWGDSQDLPHRFRAMR